MGSGDRRSETIAEVADTMEATKGVGVQIEWINLEIGKVLRTQGHQKLAHNTNLTSEQTEDMRLRRMW